MAIALMIFGGMLVLVAIVIGALIAWEYAKEWKWLKAYLSKRK